MISPVREEARRLFHSSLAAEDRVLVTGAGGWFGSTLAAILHGGAHKSVFLTQRPRTIDFGVGTAPAIGWDAAAVEAFAPTVVIDCAFILRDYIGEMSIERYVHENTVLTARLLQLVQLDSVHTAISVSSGAAVYPADATRQPLEENPYGYLKRQAELALLRLATETGKKTVVARAWSLSGGLVSRPERYALSNLILQSRAGRVVIQSNRPVSRRYIGVDDFFAVALASARPEPLVLDSGGELLEFSELARRVNATLGSVAPIERPQLDGEGEDDYYSDDLAWQRACDALGFAPAGLDQQIAVVDQYLTARRGRD